MHKNNAPLGDTPINNRNESRVSRHGNVGLGIKESDPIWPPKRRWSILVAVIVELSDFKSLHLQSWTSSIASNLELFRRRDDIAMHKMHWVHCSDGLYVMSLLMLSLSSKLQHLCQETKSSLYRSRGWLQALKGTKINLLLFIVHRAVTPLLLTRSTLTKPNTLSARPVEYRVSILLGLIQTDGV